MVFGAGDGIRTCDLLITNQLHYRLCYTSDFNIISYLKCFFKSFFVFFEDFYKNGLILLEVGPYRFAI